MLKIIALFKKIASKLKRKKKEERGKGPEVPEGNKIAIFGHTNVGKTVFFVMAHEAARQDLRFRLDTKDDQTASELLSNLKLLEGLEVAVSDGMRAEKRVERRFPPPTSQTKFLNFVAVFNQRKRFDFTSLDYRGEIASIEEQPELKEDLIKFCLKSNCILFFIEPSIISSELYCRNQIASFKSLLQLLLNGRTNLPIPVGLVVTKSDLFDDFLDDSQTVLISRPYEYVKTKKFGEFVQRLLEQPHIKKSERWRKDVKRVLERMEEFFETLTGLSSDFQVFFVSAMGSRPPQKFDDRGATIFTPPRQLKPIGVTEPLKWAVLRTLQQKRIKILKSFTKFVFWVALIWCLFFSIPNLLHLGFWYPDLFSAEQRLSKSGYKHNLSQLSEEQLQDFKNNYKRYYDKLLVCSFFGMGGLEEFARHRFDNVVASKLPEKKVVPIDSAFQKEKGGYNDLERQFNELKAEINRGSATFKLEEAPGKLNTFKTTLTSSQLSSPTAKKLIQGMIAQIDRYLNKWECWEEEKAFRLRVDEIPEGYGLYVTIGLDRFGAMHHNSPECDRDIHWKKGQPVIYSLMNDRTGGSINKPMPGNYGIVDSMINFPEIPATLKVTKIGFDCKIPSF